MTCSLTLPCHGRQDDLRCSLGDMLYAAAYDADTEIVIVDYANPAPLEPLVRAVIAESATLYPDHADVPVHVVRYRGRDHFHMAHARNIGIQASIGTYVVIGSADLQPKKDFFVDIGYQFEVTRATWLYPRRYRGIIACAREELIATGGYDERFEFYGPEDKELHARLLRRGSPHATYDDSLIRMRHTPDEKKARGYRLPLSKREMSRLGVPILKENAARGALTVNDGLVWGALA